MTLLKVLMMIAGVGVIYLSGFFVGTADIPPRLGTLCGFAGAMVTIISASRVFKN